MLRVTVELVPFGRQERATPIAVMVIGNIGIDEKGYSYSYIYKEPKPIVGPPISISGILTGYDRNNNVMNLLREILTNIDTNVEAPSDILKLRMKESWEHLNGKSS